MKETNPCSGGPQRAISLRDVMNHEHPDADLDLLSQNY